MNILRVLSYHLFFTKKTRRELSTDRQQLHGESSTSEKKQKCFIAESEKVLARSKAAAKTISNSRTALRSLQRYLGEDDIEVRCLTRHKISSYERWLLYDEGVSPNTAALYMRSLRALYNKIGVARRIDIFSAVRTTSYQSQRIEPVTVGELRKIAGYHDGSERQLLARDIFLFSFYCMGMPFIDIYNLRWSQIKGDVLTYQRHKTGVAVMVSLTPEAKEILQTYEVKDNAFVFPFLHDGKRESYATALRMYNKGLKTIEDSLSLQNHLSSYVARHTWATIAYSETCDINIVAGALGHTSTKVTRVYISMMLNRKLAKTNRKIIRRIKQPAYRQ